MIEIALGEKIRKIRESLKLTQPELGKKSGVGSQSIHLIETGQAWPRLANLSAIAKALGTTKEDLFYNPEEPTAQQLLDKLIEANAKLKKYDTIIQAGDARAENYQTLVDAAEALLKGEERLAEMMTKPGVKRGSTS